MKEFREDKKKLEEEILELIKNFEKEYNCYVDEIDLLQSKIDKANEILDKLEMQPAYLDCKYYELGGFDELRNALKEDK